MRRKLAKPTLPVEPAPRIWRCTRCGKERQEANRGRFFFSSRSELYKGNDGYMHICRSCQKELFKLYYEETQNLLEATHIMCQKLDLYYDEGFVGAHNGGVSLDGFWGTYMKNISLPQCRYKTYEDYRREQRNKVVIDSKERLIEAKENGLLVTDKAVDFFGVGFTPQDLQFLVDDYNDWITRHECNTKAQEEVFKDLAVANLKKRSAAAKNDQKAYESAVNTFQKVLETANLQPKQTKGVDTTIAEANTLGTLIEKWENDNPIPETDPEFEDVDGIKKYINVWFFGHLCKMLGIKNDAAAEYEREKAKYDVVKPAELDDDDDENEEIRDVLKAAMEKGGD